MRAAQHGMQPTRFAGARGRLMLSVGPMPADAVATISSESQQAQAAAATAEFLSGLSVSSLSE
jgi:hypothetical protein